MTFVLSPPQLGASLSLCRFMLRKILSQSSSLSPALWFASCWHRHKHTHTPTHTHTYNEKCRIVNQPTAHVWTREENGLPGGNSEALGGKNVTNRPQCFLITSIITTMSTTTAKENKIMRCIQVSKNLPVFNRELTLAYNRRVMFLWGIFLIYNSVLKRSLFIHAC